MSFGLLYPCVRCGCLVKDADHLCKPGLKPSEVRDADVHAAVTRMRTWASAHGEADTQGLMDDEWENLARAALGMPELP